jgi:hypothetical protein
MTLKNSKKWLVLLASVGLMTGFQAVALADQKQNEADLRFAAQYQQEYQNHREALAQAYRSGNQQDIQNLQAALNADISRLQANAQDLAKDGVANPYTVPSSNQGFNQGFNRGFNQGSTPPGWSHGRKTGWNGRDDQSNRRWDNGSRFDDNGNWTTGRSTSDNFRAIDRNNDGFIARDEWRHSSRSFTALDRNNDGRLDRDEFYNRGQAQAAVFTELDVNNDGAITRNEWRSDSSAFDTLDVNRNNVLTSSEFYSQSSSSGTTTQQFIEQLFQGIFKS